MVVMEASPSTSLARRLLALAVLIALTAGLILLLWFHPWEALTIILLSPLPSLPLAMGLFPGVWRRRGESPPLAATDLPRRRPVWSVLSELYLDTELDDLDNARIASVLIDSRYSAEQLEEILYRELHPVLQVNLLSVAGEWAGFDQQWLEEQILRRRPKRARFAVIPGKWMVRGEWAVLEAKLRKAAR